MSEDETRLLPRARHKKPRKVTVKRVLLTLLVAVSLGLAAAALMDYHSHEKDPYEPYERDTSLPTISTPADPSQIASRRPSPRRTTTSPTPSKSPSATSSSRLTPSPSVTITRTNTATATATKTETETEVITQDPDPVPTVTVTKTISSSPSESETHNGS